MPNRKKIFYKEYFAYATAFSPLAAGNGTSAVFTDNDIRIDPGSDFQFMSTMHTATSSNFRLQYKDDSLGRTLMKAHQHAETIVGKAFTTINSNAYWPFRWPRPYTIAGATTLTVSAADFSTSANSIRLAFHGAKVRPGSAPWEKAYRSEIPYVYPMTNAGSLSIAASSTGIASIQTDIDSAFVVMGISGRSTGACELTIKDSARGSQWMNTAIHFDNIIGNSQFPHILEAPRFIRPASVITINVADLSGSTNVVEINFIGRKLYE